MLYFSVASWTIIRKDEFPFKLFWNHQSMHPAATPHTNLSSNDGINDASST